MAIRKIVTIDEKKCDGCGLCVQSCAEGALQVVDGKARLINEVYCDGLGACLCECPQDAITIEEREAEDFDITSVQRHLEETKEGIASLVAGEETGEVCPGSAPRRIERCEMLEGKTEAPEEEGEPSRLENWPVQIQLVPPSAPYFDGADLLIAADCVPFALADFHRRFLENKILLVGCPKLDNAEFYRRKLPQIFIQNEIKSVTVAYMEVPCCFGLVHLVHESIKESGKEIPFKAIKIGINGKIIETTSEAEGGRD